MNSERISFIYGLVFGAAAVVAIVIITKLINPDSFHIKIINNSDNPIEKTLIQTSKKIYGRMSSDFSFESDTGINVEATEPMTYETTVIFKNGKVLTKTSPTVEPGWVIYEYIDEEEIQTNIRSK
jgi:hypothetical protein